MKFIFKQFLRVYLKYITKMALFINRPKIIVVAGSINKPFVKDEIKRVLKEEGIEARANPKNFNTEIGLPLSILGLPSGYNSYKKWLPAILKAPGKIVKNNFPNYLVLSLGTSDPGDMKYLLSIIKPDVSVITDITQRYLESFSDMDQLVREYEYLAGKTRKNGMIVLNYDNYRIRAISKNINNNVVFFGLSREAEYSAELKSKSNQGQIVEISSRGKSTIFKINKFGCHHITSLLIGQIIKDHVARQSQ